MIEARTVSLDHFLVALSEGWMFDYPTWYVGGMVAGPMAGSHGGWCCLLTRPLDDDDG